MRCHPADALRMGQTARNSEPAAVAEPRMQPDRVVVEAPRLDQRTQFSKVASTCSFRHASRKRPLKLLPNLFASAYSAPCCAKPCSCAQRSTALPSVPCHYQWPSPQGRRDARQAGCLNQVRNRTLPRRRLHNFPDAISFSAALTSVASARRRFSFVFSASSPRSPGASSYADSTSP